MESNNLNSITFEIKGEPMGKQRPKFSRVGNFVKTYTPKETINYEQWVKACYLSAGGRHYGSQAMKIEVHIYYKIPKAYSKKKTQQALDGTIVPTIKPDCDNVLKIICDSLNGIAYDDDKQIACVLIQKHYSTEPSVVVTLGAKTQNKLIHTLKANDAIIKQ